MGEMKGPTRSGALAVITTLTASGCAGSHQSVGQPSTTHRRDTAAPQVSLTPKTAISSRLILDGRVRCTATVSRTLQAGQPLGLSFALHNVSTHTARVYLGTWAYGRCRSCELA